MSLFNPSQIGELIRRGIDVSWYGADPTGTNDSTQAIKNAISAVNTSGGKGGIVYIPVGVYVISSTITVPAQVKIVGAGSRATIINSNAPNTAFLFTDTNFSGLIGARVAIGTTSSTAVALELYSNTAWVQWNNFYDVELAGDGITNGQIGIWTHSKDNTTTVAYNLFENIRLFNFHKPIVQPQYNEANVWDGLHINGFGINPGDVAIDFTGNATHWLGVWIGKGNSSASSLVGMSYNAENCIFDIIGDIGSGQVMQLKSGVTMPTGTTANQYRVTGTLGVTSVGDILQYPVFTEGTFTPTVVGTTTAGTATYTAQNGSFTKIGNRVLFDMLVTWSAHTGTGNIQINGLPFPQDTVEPQSVNWAMTNGITMTEQAFMLVESSQSYAAMYQDNNGSISALPISASGTIRVTGTYRTSS